MRDVATFDPKQLLDDDFVHRVLARNGHERGGWRRTYGKFETRGTAYATLLYESPPPDADRCLIQVCHAPIAGQPCIEWPGRGWLRVTPFPKDPVLRTLPAVLAGAPDAEVVRYRPARRCTVRVGRGAGARYGKVFADDRGDRLDREALALHRASACGAVGFAAARPLLWDASARVLWHAAVPGVPLVDRLFGPGGPALGRRLGAAAASLAVSDLEPETRFDADMQLARSRRYLADVVARFPALTGSCAVLLARIEDRRLTLPERELRPIHGAPHPHQWLLEADRLALVDFDRHAWGDPELDVATFLAEMDFENRRRVPVDAINAAFVAGYESVHGRLERCRLSWYRAQKRLAKVRRSAFALRRDAEQRAWKHLQSALEATE